MHVLKTHKFDCMPWWQTLTSAARWAAFACHLPQQRFLKNLCINGHSPCAAEYFRFQPMLCLPQKRGALSALSNLQIMNSLDARFGYLSFGNAVLEMLLWMK
jgi:hypothetical protein